MRERNCYISYVLLVGMVLMMFEDQVERISRQSEDVFEQSTDSRIDIINNSYVYDVCRLKLGK